MSTLIAALQTADMLEIDGLHAWQFELNADATPPNARALSVECMDGRTRRVWHFSLEQINAATYEADCDHWQLSDEQGEHTLKCFAAFCGDNLDAEESAAQD